MTINFQTQNVELPALDYNAVKLWLDAVARAHSRVIGDLNYIFCDDPRILEVNLQFLQHDYFTDVITFDYSRRHYVSGDIFISLDTVATNAEIVGATYTTELLRVIAHGLLHLCGINDKGPGERAIMEANEDAALELLPRELAEARL